MFSEKWVWSGFWTTLFGPRPDVPVIDLTVIWTPGNTTLSTIVNIASWSHFLTAITTLISSLQNLSVQSLDHDLYVSRRLLVSWKFFKKPPFSISMASFLATSALAFLSMTKPFYVSFNWLSRNLFWCFIPRVENIFMATIEFWEQWYLQFSNRINKDLKGSNQDSLQVLYESENCFVFLGQLRLVDFSCNYVYHPPMDVFWKWRYFFS